DLHSDPGRTGFCYRNRQLVYLPHGIPFFQFWLRRRDVVSRARTHDCFRQVADARNAGAARLEMKSAIKYLLALLALAAAVAPIVTIVPLFLMLRGAGLLNSRLGLIIVYTAFNLPFVVWMMQGFFREIPRELEEAAMMDGDSRMGVLVRVVLPVAKPGLAATVVFCLIVAWNEFLFALILTQTAASTTLPVAIASRVTQYEIKWGAMSAAGVVAMI